MKHLVQSGNQKKKDPLCGFFFFFAPSACCAFSAPPPNWIALAPCPTSYSRLDRRCAYPRMASMSCPIYLWGESWVNPLPDEASRQVGTRKTDPLHGSFFPTGLQPVLPLSQCSPSKSVALHPKCLHKSAPSPLVSSHSTQR